MDIVSSMNEKEKHCLEKFKLIVADLNQEDETLLRFLRARDHDFKRAEEMLRKSITWRTEVLRVDELSLWTPPPILREKFRVYYDHVGYDREGAPILYLPLGDYQTMECLNHGMKDDIQKVILHALVQFTYLTKESRCSTILTVVDMAKLRFKQTLHLDSMKLLYYAFQIFEANYPETLKFAFIVNTQWIFPMAFNFFRPVLAKATLSKIAIYGNDKQTWTPKLLEKISEETLAAIKWA